MLAQGFAPRPRLLDGRNRAGSFLFYVETFLRFFEQFFSGLSSQILYHTVIFYDLQLIPGEQNTEEIIESLFSGIIGIFLSSLLGDLYRRSGSVMSVRHIDTIHFSK